MKVSSSENASEAGETGTASQRVTILIVDDEEEILVALTDLLEDDYEILTQSDPLQALEVLRAHPEVAVIISDQRMPGLSGDRLLSQARAFSDARSLLLTGYADLDAVVAALNEGQVQAYVHKPWDEKALRALVAEVARHCLSQRALKTEQALLHGLMKALPFTLVFSDAQGRCIRSNVAPRAGEETSRESAHYPPEVQAEMRRLRLLTQQTGQAASTFCAQEEGQTHWHEMTRWALAWPQKASFAEAWQVCLDRDVTDRVAVEARLRQAERLESLGTLAGGIAHDFNNLLAAISGALDLLEEDIDAQSAGRALLTQAQEGVQKGAAMTRRLLQFGRQGGDSLAPVAPGPFMKALAPLLAQSLRATAVCCQLELDMGDEGGAGLPDMLTDARQLEMALLNLCVNARDAMPQGGRVRISLAVVPADLPDVPGGCRKDQALAVKVQDDGLGMSAAVQARVFDPFFTTKPVGKGTGLGLSGVYGFVTRAHGDVKLASAPGKGTTVTLLLPLLQEASSGIDGSSKSVSKARRTPEAKAVEAPAAQTSMNRVMEGRAMLIVEDEEPVRRVVGQFLRQEGALTREANGLQEALSVLESGFQPEVAILDVRMPDYDGPSCARVLKERLPGLKILFMSGETAGAVLDGARLISKPFTQLQLRLALQELCSPSEEGVSEEADMKSGGTEKEK
ncbi:hybrid sensor histidine kinase/response regulator [Oecophyllibacter saccharovorans]|uniref:response regulator n=1 Tax=Oecophyllibacter saccharovorans TaxID=2558360 RepID=UPI0011444C16|nr:response regulator [Oecophyllibacter saccharovorans]QDH14737.1 hybrid sensor histidine kinase/response regulator [Oecophyllibacter saccharovorans]